MLLRDCVEESIRSMGLPLVPWSTRFDEPIPLPRGRQLRTLKDAGNYITKLPKAEHEAKEWQTAMEALILVGETDGPTMFARIGVMQALNRHVERVFNPTRKEHHWGRRKLARDSPDLRQHQQASRRSRSSQGVRKCGCRRNVVRGK
jgi:hypothetical protein